MHHLRWYLLKICLRHGMLLLDDWNVICLCGGGAFVWTQHVALWGDSPNFGSHLLLQCVWPHPAQLLWLRHWQHGQLQPSVLHQLSFASALAFFFASSSAFIFAAISLCASAAAFFSAACLATLLAASCLAASASLSLSRSDFTVTRPQANFFNSAAHS